MDRQTFKLLYEKVSLVRSRKVSLKAMVAISLSIFAHHLENWVVGFNFKRLGKIVNKCFHECLKAIIRCQKKFWNQWI